MGRGKTFSDDALLDAARAAIDRTGPVDFTIRQVAEIAGASPGLIIQRFGSKAKLVQRLHDRAVRWSSSIRVARTRSLVERARLLAWALVPEPDSGVPGPTNFSALQVVPGSEPVLRDGARSVLASIQAAIRRFVAESVEDGLLPRARQEDLAAVLEYAYHGVLATHAIQGASPARERVRLVFERVVSLAEGNASPT